MPLIDFNKPATTDAYATAFVPNIQSNMAALAMWLDSSVVTYNNLQTNMKRWNNTSGAFEYYNGTSWLALGMAYALKTGDTFTGSLSLANNVPLQSKDSGGTARRMHVVTAANGVYFGDIDFAIAGGSVEYRAVVVHTFNVNGTGVANITANGIGFGGSPVVPIHVQNGHDECLRLQYSSAYLTGYNTAGSTRTGYLQFNAAANVTLAAENGAFMSLYVGGAERVRLDTNGNFGLSVTPSPWISSFRAIEMQSGAALSSNSNSVFVGQNWYFGTSDTYRVTAAASRYLQNAGAHQWHIAPSGTAGAAITFTTAMTLDNSGNLLIGSSATAWGTTNRGVVEINGVSTALLGLKINGAASGYLYHDGTNMHVFNAGGAVTLDANGTTRLTVNTNGSTVFTGAAATTPIAPVNSGTAITLDCSKSNVFNITMTGNVAASAASGQFTNMSDGQTINVWLTQDGTGTRTWSMPSANGFKWFGGTVGVLSTAIGAIDLLTVTYRAANSTYVCSLGKAAA
jgi:hypothetical protein